MISSSSPSKSPFVFTRIFQEFFRSEKFSGFLLIACTLVSLGIANSGIGPAYLDFWEQSVGPLSISHWINEGLMAIFFLLVGLEIEREIYIGELSTFRHAALPMIAAIGGMLVPALIHFTLNGGTSTASGAGIPMATDIAFALGVLSLAGKSVPPAIKVFLTALAIIDDLGAILVIALFYTSQLAWIYLIGALSIFGILFYLGKKGMMYLPIYLVGGVVMWVCLYRSGVHATISGVLLAFAIPFGKGTHASLSEKLQQFLQPIVAYGIIPLFALANTGMLIGQELAPTLVSLNSLGIMLGLFAGKPIGVFLFSYVAAQLKWAALPSGVQWKHILAAGMLAGIGFTMSIFITLLAFPDASTVISSKVAILLASLFSAIVGLFSFQLMGSARNA